MAKTKRKLRDALKKRSRTLSTSSTSSRPTDDRLSSCRDEQYRNRVTKDDKDSSLLVRLMETKESNDGEAMEVSPANSDIMPEISPAVVLQTLGNRASRYRKAISKQSADKPLSKSAKKGSKPNEYKRSDSNDDLNHEACTECGSQVHPQKAGSNNKDEYWWRCLNKQCRRWYSRTNQRPTIRRISGSRESARVMSRKTTIDKSDRNINKSGNNAFKYTDSSSDQSRHDGEDDQLIEDYEDEEAELIVQTKQQRRNRFSAHKNKKNGKSGKTHTKICFIPCPGQRELVTLL